MAKTKSFCLLLSLFIFEIECKRVDAGNGCRFWDRLGQGCARDAEKPLPTRVDDLIGRFGACHTAHGDQLTQVIELVAEQQQHPNIVITHAE